MNEELFSEIERLIADIAARRYVALAADGRIGRLTTVELEQTIVRYRRSIVPLPKQGRDLIEMYADRKDANQYAIDVPLWTIEEGRSDLTLLLHAKKYQNRWRLSIDDIRVL